MIILVGQVVGSSRLYSIITIQLNTIFASNFTMIILYGMGWKIKQFFDQPGKKIKHPERGGGVNRKPLNSTHP